MLFALLEKISHYDNVDDVWSALHEFVQSRGFNHMVYGVKTPGSAGRAIAAFHSTHEEWLSQFLAQSLQFSCYFSNRGLEETAPFIGGLEYLPEPWASDENYRKVSQIAFDYGFERSLAIPLTLYKSVTGNSGIVFHTDLPKEEFEENVRRYQADLTIASLYADEWLRPHYMSKLVKINAPTLSKRQNEVLSLFLRGVPNKEIAFQLDISPPTVSFHLKEIMMRLGAHSAREITSKAILLGLVSPDEIATSQVLSQAN